MNDDPVAGSPAVLNGGHIHIRGWPTLAGRSIQLAFIRRSLHPAGRLAWLEIALLSPN